MSEEPELLEEEEEVEELEVDSLELPCSQCGAEMVFDAAAAAMRCAHCAHTQPLQGEDAFAAVVERDLEQGLALGVERGLGLEVRSTRCKECGATVSFGATETAKACEFCGSSQVMEQEGNRKLLRPESLVPFGVEEAQARAKFATWLKGLWFRPNDLSSSARADALVGVYVPYWTFDARVRSSWTAQSGTYYYVTKSYTDAQGNRKTRRVRKTRWRWTSGKRRDSFDDVLVCASRGLPRKLADKLSSFDTDALVAYRPQYLAGWRAEEYAVELNDGWTRAVQHMEARQRSRCSSDVPGDTQRFLKVQNAFSHETFKHVLLPIWISSYRYKDEPYRFLVNGQTGEVVGEAPWSWIKISLAVLGVIALGLGIAALSNM